MVKRVATSIITVAVLMGSLIACAGSDNEVAELRSELEEAKDEPEKVPEDQGEQQSKQEQPTPKPRPTTSEPSPPPVLHPPAEVRVLVANGTNVSGAASAIKEVLVSDQGYNGLAPVNDTSEEVPTETVVYYANGYELDAVNIAVIINVKNNILAMPAVLPVTDLNEANILVLLGSDLYPEEAMEPEPIPEDFKLLSDESICGRSGSGPIFGSSGDCQKTKPIWSPDGQQIFFIDQKDSSGPFREVGESSGIYVMDLDGSNLSKILGIAEAKYSADVVNHKSLSLSPDGERIAFVEQCPDCPGNMRAGAGTYLYVADSDGSNRTALNGQDFEACCYLWSADGESLTYNVDGRPGQSMSSRTIRNYVRNVADGTDKEVSGFGYKQVPVLSSPDGTLIAGTIVEKAYGTYNGKRLFIMLIDGPPLSLVLEQDEETFIDKPKFWSADGQHIIFDRFIYSGSGQFTSGPLENEPIPQDPRPVQVYEFRYDVVRMIMDIDDLTARPLTESERLQYQDGISPDGTKVVFAQTVNDSSEIFIRDADGTNVKQLTFSDN